MPFKSVADYEFQDIECECGRFQHIFPTFADLKKAPDPSFWINVAARCCYKQLVGFLENHFPLPNYAAHNIIPVEQLEEQLDLDLGENLFPRRFFFTLEGPSPDNYYTVYLVPESLCEDAVALEFSNTLRIAVLAPEATRTALEASEMAQI